MGLAALIWFLIRVIPKPSRASYPCQKAAFPIASGFVLWLTGLLGAGVALGKGRQLLVRARYLLALTCLVIAGVLAYQAWNAAPERAARAAGSYGNAALPNHPIGVAKGIFPGRVTWVYDRNATNWDGVEVPSTGNKNTDGNLRGYWGTSSVAGGDLTGTFTNQTEVNHMFSQNLQWLTGTTSDAAAWGALFTYFNAAHGKGAVGYAGGEQIMIKVNWTTSNAGGAGAITTSGANAGVMANDRRYVEPSPELLIALLHELVYVAGIPQGRITIGDTTGDWPKHVYNKVIAGEDAQHPLASVIYIGKHNGAGAIPYQHAVSPSADELHFSAPAAAQVTDSGGAVTSKTYVPDCYESASYLINMALMKTHALAGVTLCAKNHYGSMIRTPNAAGYFSTHKSLANVSSNAGSYRAVVDLGGHPKIGGNTMLCIMDALWGGYDWSEVAPPQLWKSAPFNNHWLSSIMMSQDPVALDSVCYDIWLAENAAATLPALSGGMTPANSGVEDYMYEEALANAPLSGITYMPDGTHPLASLGTHEHWRSTSAHLYSRNLGMVMGPGPGIELVAAAPGNIQGRWIFYNNSAWDGNNPGADGNDDLAIAPDKTPLLPGGTASFINYTSYSKGINGVMVDVSGLSGTPTFNDFTCLVGNSGTLDGSWTPAAPAVTIRPGAGINGSTRITLIWADGTAKGQWLRVQMNANSGINLPADVFYVGNAPGETGNSATDANVDALDEGPCRADPHNFANPATITNPHDFNRDQHVDMLDEGIARNNATNSTTALKLISAP